MKSVLISIRPKWCELIASGKKTVEVRKTRPKINTPFKCYIYCTKPKMITKYVFKPEDYPEYMRPEKTVFCKVRDASSPFCSEVNGNGKVIGEFVCDCIVDFEPTEKGIISKPFSALNDTCLKLSEILNYAGGKNVYGWHISDLKIYDKPKELGEFRIEDKAAIKICEHRFRTGQPEDVTRHGGWLQCGFICMKSGEPEWCENCLSKPLTRPPQSWCYVEEVKK